MKNIVFGLGSTIRSDPHQALCKDFPRAKSGRKPCRLVNGGLSLIVLLLISASLLHAQPGPISIRPDCFQFFTFTATGNSAVFDNRQAGCPYWTIVYTSNGFSGLSLVLQVAPDAGGTPGTWATYGATSGSNPNTATTQANSLFNGPYFPWLRAQLTTATGTGSVSGIFYGWRTPAIIINGGGVGSGCVGTVGTPCVVDGPTAPGAAATKPPVMIGGQDASGKVEIVQTTTSGAILPAGSGNPDLGDGVNMTSLSGPQVLSGGFILPGIQPTLPYVFTGQTFGTAWDRTFSCTNQANVTLSASGLTRIITNGGVGTIRICALSLSFASPVDIRVVEGTQTTTACDTGASNMTGLFRSVTAIDPPWGSIAALRESTAFDDICISMSANVNGGGVIIYANY